MTFFNMNTSDMLEPQDWGFPIPISYGPGRLNEIGKSCQNLNIKKPLIVTDRGSKDLPFIADLVKYLESSNVNPSLVMWSRVSLACPLLTSLSWERS